ILLRRVRDLVVFFLVLNLQRFCLAGNSLLPKRAHAGYVAAPALIDLSLTTRKGRRRPSPPPNCAHRFRTFSPKALNSRLTLFLQPNHGFADSFSGPYPSPPHDFSIQRSLHTLPNAPPTP